MPTSALADCPQFHALRQHADAGLASARMTDLFRAQPDRFAAMSLDAAGLFLDYSKNRLDARALQLLLELAEARGVAPARDAMFAGEKINRTEGRAVLHTALRAPRTQQLEVDGQDAIADVHRVLDRLHVFSEQVRSGAWVGHNGLAITDIVNIGIGGSDLGPKMVCLGLRPYVHPRLRMHFVSNVDGADLDATLAKVHQDTTLFIVASKTFTTAETMQNAGSARAWFLQRGDDAGLAKHFVAVSTNTELVQQFGIDAANMFPFWDWVGGRYSVWSAIGLPVALAVGFPRFAEFLAGAHEMDQHFQRAPLAQNMPVLLALVGLWNRNVLGCASVSIAPYHQDLSRFPAYLQQLEMESNGKSVTVDGAPAGVTCPTIWGDCGTNGQHAYFQLLHQGSDTIPVDFIAALKPNHDLAGHQEQLLANCFAQSEALMTGKDAEAVRADLLAGGMAAADAEALVAHKTFPGNRPSNTILFERLSPAALGALIALYEHKTFVQGVLWNVASFDQWGVELGKVLAKNILPELTGAPKPEAHDGSTNGLIARARLALLK
ncbi:MAG TPA: glucose-6-phosphate isomerase [Burkholderiaceae bacterium]